jgi:hypothetical protein
MTDRIRILEWMGFGRRRPPKVEDGEYPTGPLGTGEPYIPGDEDDVCEEPHRHILPLKFTAEDATTLEEVAVALEEMAAELRDESVRGAQLLMQVSGGQVHYAAPAETCPACGGRFDDPDPELAKS